MMVRPRALVLSEALKGHYQVSDPLAGGGHMYACGGFGFEAPTIPFPVLGEALDKVRGRGGGLLWLVGDAPLFWNAVVYFRERGSCGSAAWDDLLRLAVTEPVLSKVKCPFASTRVGCFAAPCPLAH